MELSRHFWELKKLVGPNVIRKAMDTINFAAKGKSNIF